jgi:hypothetical protein
VHHRRLISGVRLCIAGSSALPLSQRSLDILKLYAVPKIYKAVLLLFSNRMEPLLVGHQKCTTSWMQHLEINVVSGNVQTHGPQLHLYHSKWLISLWSNQRHCLGQRFHSPPELRQLVATAFASVTPDMLGNTWRELDHPYDLCHVRNGDHVGN